MGLPTPPEPRGTSLLTGMRWVLVANVVYLFGSAILTLVVPRYMDPFEFGLWQLYHLYGLYLSYATFGYSDGIQLRLGGLRYREVPRQQVRTGFALLVLGDALLFALLCAGFYVFSDQDPSLLVLAAVGALAYVPRLLLTTVFQVTGAVRRFAAVMVVERVVIVVGTLLALTAGAQDAVVLVQVDVIGKYVGLALALWVGRHALRGGRRPLRETWAIFWRDCRDGAYVLGGNLSAVLIQALVRLVIVAVWGVVVFGQATLALQFASLFMVVVTSVSVAAFPNLKRLELSGYPAAYLRLSHQLVRPVVLSIGLYFPAVVLLDRWLPAYDQVGSFLAILFPICIYESRSRGLAAPYLKALRMERAILRINLLALVLTMAIALVAAFVLEQLYLTLLAIVIGMAFRAFASERAVARRLSAPLLRGWRLETPVVIVFLVVTALGSSSGCSSGGWSASAAERCSPTRPGCWSCRTSSGRLAAARPAFSPPCWRPAPSPLS